MLFRSVVSSAVHQDDLCITSALCHSLAPCAVSQLYAMCTESAEFYYPDNTEDVNSDKEIVNFLKESFFVLELKPF